MLFRSLDEALRIRREEELPVYERLGDVRSRAVTMGNIADILQSRGDLDEALRIRREVQLPVFERLGDTRETAVTWGRIADIASRRDTCERRRDVETDQVFVPARACRRELYRLFVMKRGERLTTRCSAWA